MNDRPFVILSLPRSRTAWLSRFLSYGDWTCGHEEARHFRTVDDVKSWLAQPQTGTVETAVAAHWRLLRKIRPDTKIAIVRRPVGEVLDSMLRQYSFPKELLRQSLLRQEAKLDQVAARWPGVLQVSYKNLSFWGGKMIWEHCLPLPYDWQWHNQMNRTNVQIDLGAMMKYFIAYQGQMTKLMAGAKELQLGELERRRRPLALDDLELSLEPFVRFYGAAQAAFRQHLATTDQMPDPGLKNIELLRTLDSKGALQCAVARCNGKVFGYLMTIISPSLDSPSALSAEHTTFWADPGFPGLGLRLQRFAREALRARGVSQVQMRAGIAGTGPRLATLYRRIGAKPLGTLYQLGLEN